MVPDPRGAALHIGTLIGTPACIQTHTQRPIDIGEHNRGYSQTHAFSVVDTGMQRPGLPYNQRLNFPANRSAASPQPFVDDLAKVTFPSEGNLNPLMEEGANTYLADSSQLGITSQAISALG